VNKTEIAAVQREVELHKAAMERLGNEGASNFELDYQAGMIGGLTLALKVARRARR
jgi:hypothetical protein